MDVFFDKLDFEKVICSCGNIQNNLVLGFRIYFPNRFVYTENKIFVNCNKCGKKHDMVIFGQQYQTNYTFDKVFDESNILYYTNKINRLKLEIAIISNSWAKREKEISLENAIKERYLLLKRNDFRYSKLGILTEFKIAV